MPINYDLQKIQAIEFNDQIRKANYSFELINNKLRIFPLPTKDYTLYFKYLLNGLSNRARIESTIFLCPGAVKSYSTLVY